MEICIVEWLANPAKSSIVLSIDSIHPNVSTKYAIIN
jgi:hypothetical protein